MKEFCEIIERKLAIAKDFGVAFCAAKTIWFHLYAKGRVTSTRNGADFFKVVIKAFNEGVYEYVGEEYDKQFALTLQEHGIKIKKIKESVD